MAGYYNRRAERQRKERDTPERIVSIAKARGSFEVSLRYRDSWLRKRCGELRSQGLLTGGARKGDRLVFYPAAARPGTTLTAAGERGVQAPRSAAANGLGLVLPSDGPGHGAGSTRGPTVTDPGMHPSNQAKDEG